MAGKSAIAIFCALFVAIFHHAGGEIVKGSVNLNSGVFDKVGAGFTWKIAVLVEF